MQSEQSAGCIEIQGQMDNLSIEHNVVTGLVRSGRGFKLCLDKPHVMVRQAR